MDKILLKSLGSSILFFMTFSIIAQSAHKNLRNGDMLYEYGKYQDAELEYRKADTDKSSVKSSYNLGNTLVNQERYDEAIKSYESAAAKATSDDQKSKIYHNQGNAFFRKEKYKESIDAFKKSLKYKPSDQATKENLAMAHTEWKKQLQQQQKDQQKNKDKNQNQDKKEGQQDKNNQDNKDKNQDQNEDQKNENQNQDQQNQDQQDQQKGQDQADKDGKKMTKEDAQKLLEVMDSEEKKVQQKMRRMDGKGKKPTKDW